MTSLSTCFRTNGVKVGITSFIVNTAYYPNRLPFNLFCATKAAASHTFAAYIVGNSSASRHWSKEARTVAYFALGFVFACLLWGAAGAVNRSWAPDLTSRVWQEAGSAGLGLLITIIPTE